MDTLADRRAIHSGHTLVTHERGTSSEILDRAKEFGARVLSVHPLQSFANPDMAIENLPGSVSALKETGRLLMSLSVSLKRWEESISL